MFELLEVSQEACTASKHMVHMDTAITEALRPFLKQGGGYDWQLFGQVFLGAVYFRSFAPEVQDIARQSIRDLTAKIFTYGKVRNVVRLDTNVQKLGQLSAGRVQ